jgi:hypothetical protein
MQNAPSRYNPSVRKLRGVVLTALGVLCLPLLVAALAFWVRSYWSADTLTCELRSGSFVEASIGHGRICTQWMRALRPRTANSRPAWRFSHMDEQNYARQADGRPYWWGLTGSWGFRSTYIRHGPVAGGTLRDQHGGYLVATPCWLPALILLLPTLRIARLIRGRRRRRALSKECCPSCGYDLRATPARCPECGPAALAVVSADRDRRPS